MNWSHFLALHWINCLVFLYFRFIHNSFSNEPDAQTINIFMIERIWRVVAHNFFFFCFHSIFESTWFAMQKREEKTRRRRFMDHSFVFNVPSSNLYTYKAVCAFGVFVQWMIVDRPIITRINKYLWALQKSFPPPFNF